MHNHVHFIRELPLRINFYPISYMKLQMYSSLDIGMSKQSGMMGGTGGELDEVKRMLIETNPYLLALTVIVSCLHSAFEMLAFKNGKFSALQSTWISNNAVLLGCGPIAKIIYSLPMSCRYCILEG